MPVAVVGSAHDQLCALPRRSKHRRVPVLRQLRLALCRTVADQSHRAQDRLPGLIRGQRLQALLTGQLDVHTEPVGQQSQLMHQLRRRTGDSFGVDVTVETILLPQDTQGTDHLFHGVVRIAQYAAGEEQTFYVIPPKEADGQFRQFTGRESGAARIIAAPVDAVLAVVHAGVAHQHLQQRDASPIGRKAVTAAGDGRGGVANHTRSESAAHAAGRTRRVVFGRIRQYRQLVQQLHAFMPCGGAGAPACQYSR